MNRGTCVMAQHPEGSVHPRHGRWAQTGLSPTTMLLIDRLFRNVFWGRQGGSRSRILHAARKVVLEGQQRLSLADIRRKHVSRVSATRSDTRS